MRLPLLIFLILPSFAFAQLDRLRPSMTEREFVSAFPHAVRNLDEESYWTGGGDTLDGIIGSSLWLMYNDTTTAYRFLSTKVEGPSSAYPDFDSTVVHNMKVCLDKVRSALEEQFGKPTLYRNNSMQMVGKEGVNRAYTALWKFPGNNDYIQLSISTDLSSGNFINAPGKFTVVESQSYEMCVEITHVDDYTMLWYDLGKSSERFYTIHKNFRVPLLRDRIYTMSDSAVSSNAGWTFKFTNSKLVSFSYSATTGTGYGAKTDALAYTTVKNKGAQLLSEGEKANGKEDSLSNLMMPKHKPHDRQLVYHVDHLYARWKTAEGNILLTLEETGGGKHPGVIFVLRATFE